MRQWARLGPYHALDAMRLDGAGDTERWGAAIAAVFGAHGFGPPEWVREYEDIETAVAEEMNEIFGDGEGPFRFFVAPEGGDSHWLGVVWDHWVADSVTIRELMRRMHAAWNGAKLPPLRFAAPPRSTVSEAFGMLLEGRRFRTAFRLPVRDVLDLRVGVCIREFPCEVAGELRDLARRHGATVNDCFIAMIMLLLGERTAATRAKQRRRNEVAIGVAADTRHLFPEESRDAFGFFLTCFSIQQAAPEKIPFPELLARVAGETRALKADRALVRHDGAWRALRWWARLNVFRRQRAGFIHRCAPCVAGLSNVNLDAGWLPQAAGLLDYRRISPCGPLTPIVFAPTTLRGRLALAITHRLNFFDAAQAGRLATDCVLRLTAIARGNVTTPFPADSWPRARRLGPEDAAIRLRLGSPSPVGGGTIATELYRISPQGDLVTCTGEVIPFSPRLEGGAEVGEVTPDGLALSGWVLNHDEPDAPLDVIAVVDGMVAGSGRSSIPRPDIGSFFAMKNPPAGFTIALPRPASDDPVVRLFAVSLGGHAREVNYVSGLFKLRHR